MKTNHRNVLRGVCVLTLAASMEAMAGSGPLPSGYTTTIGGVTIVPGLTSLDITQTGNRAIINWDSYSIDKGYSVTYKLPTLDSAVLNRITGTDPTVISGSLSSYVGSGVGGNVFLLNPNGVLVSSSGVINVGGFVASTLNVNDDDFKDTAKTSLNFSGTSAASVQNAGTITASGDVFLLANTVQNDGAITAGGRAGLAAGTDILLSTTGSERLTIYAGTASGSDGVKNSVGAAINAAAIELKAAGGNVYALAINNSGELHATHLALENGGIYLRSGNTDKTAGTFAASGKVSSTGTVEADGDVVMTADNIGLGGTVKTTTGTQTYQGAVTLAGDTTLTAEKVAFQGPVDGTSDGTENLQITGDAQFDSAIGQSVKLNSLTVSGGAELNGGTVTTTGDQSYGKDVTLGADTTLTGGNINLAGVVGGGKDLALVNSKTATLGGTVSGVNTLSANGSGSLAVNNTISAGTVTDNESTTLSGVTVTTTGDQTYTRDVTLGTDTTLTGANINLAGVTGAGKNLTLANNKTATLGGAVNGVNALSANGTGSLAVNNTISAGTITDNEGTTLSGVTVITTSDQTYTKDVTLGSDITLTGGNINLAAVTGNGKNLSLVNSKAATLGGAVNGVNTLSADGTGSLAVNNTVSATAVSDRETTTLSGGTVTTTGDQTYSKDVTLGTDTTLTGANINLADVTGGGKDLTLANNKVASLNGTVDGVNTLTASGVGSLAVKKTVVAGAVIDNETTTLSGGTVTTTGDQTYSKDVTLGTDTTLTGANVNLADVTGGGKDLTLANTKVASFNGPVDGVNTLTASGVGSLAVKKAVVAGDVIDNESTTLSGATVSTTGDQTYTRDVTLGTDATLTGANINLAGVAGAGKNLTLVNSKTATLGGAVNGVNALNASGAGNLEVNNTVSVGTVTDNESTTLNGGTVTTSSDQTYSKDVTLGTDTTLTGGNVDLAGVAGAGKNLTLVNSKTATLGGAVNGVNALSASGTGSLAVNSTVSAGNITDNESTTLGGATVTTTGDQTYTRDLTLGTDTTLTGENINLSGVTGSGKNLSLVNSKTATLGGAVNGVNTLTANGGGNLAVNNTVSAGNVTDNEISTLSGATVTTTGDQTYTKDVTLGTDTTLTGGNINLVGVTGGGKNLTLVNSKAATLNGAVSSVNALNAIGTGNLAANNTVSAATVSDNETTTLNGGAVTTTGDQTYSKDVTLATETTLTGANINLASVTGNGKNLSLVNSKTATIGGAVNGVDALSASGTGSLAVNSPISAGTVTDNESTTLSGATVTTTGDQTYTRDLTLGTDTTLTGANINLAGVTGAGKNLTLVNNKTATLGGAVNGVNALSANGAGNLAVNNAVSVGAVSDNETTTINGGTVTTTGDQTYSKDMMLGTDTTLTGVNINLSGVTGNGKNFSLVNNKTATLGGAVNGVNTLSASGTGSLAVNNTVSAATVSDYESTTLNGGTVTTSSDQTYSKAVTLGTDTTLSSTGTGNITFNETVNGARALTVDTRGTTTFESTIGGGHLLTSLTTGVNNGAIKLGGDIFAGRITFNGGSLEVTKTQGIIVITTGGEGSQKYLSQTINASSVNPLVAIEKSGSTVVSVAIQLNKTSTKATELNKTTHDVNVAAPVQSTIENAPVVTKEPGILGSYLKRSGGVTK